jgi:hypothetical protein
MSERSAKRCTAFCGMDRVAAGTLADVAERTKDIAEQGGSVLIFDDLTGEQIDIDLRAAAEAVRGRLATPSEAASHSAEAGGSRRPGRPKLGVVAREVTLLPRHWDWLNRQPGGASVALRKLVEEARRVHAGRDRVRQSQEAAYRFMSAMAGNLPGFEEATRALFAGRADRFRALIEAWPPDIRAHAEMLATSALTQSSVG